MHSLLALISSLSGKAGTQRKRKGMRKMVYRQWILHLLFQLQTFILIVTMTQSELQFCSVQTELFGQKLHMLWQKLHMKSLYTTTKDLNLWHNLTPKPFCSTLIFYTPFQSTCLLIPLFLPPCFCSLHSFVLQSIPQFSNFLAWYFQHPYI